MITSDGKFMNHDNVFVMDIVVSQCCIDAHNSSTVVKPRYLATIHLGLNDGERQGWRLNEGSVNEPVTSCLLCWLARL